MMGITLVEYKKTVTDPMTMFVVNEFLQSELLQVLPFLNVTGGSYRYDKVAKLPGVGFRGINEAFSKSSGVINPQVETTQLYGGDMDVDVALVDRMGAAGRQIHTQLKLSAARLGFERTFVKGDSITDPRSFDGLQNRVAGAQLIDNGPDATGNVLSINSLDRMIDQVKVPGLKYLFMNDTVARIIEQFYRDNGGGLLRYEVNDRSEPVMFYRGARVIRLQTDENNNDILPFTEASGDGSTTNNTSVYCCVFGPTFVTGLQSPSNGVSGIYVEDFGRIPDAPVYRTRVHWDVGMAISNSRSVARLRGIQDGVAVA